MITTAEVFMWGTKIGTIHQDENKPYASFEYDEEYIKSGIEISPIKMPLSNAVYEFPSLKDDPFFGLPGLVSDSLPDRFGNTVIECWITSQGKSMKDFTAIDRLCYTGKRGMGALEYKPVCYDIEDRNENINVSEMAKFASKILSDREGVTINTKEMPDYSKLVQIGTSAGGARAKALIALNKKTNEIKSGQLDLDEDFEYWLIKFDNVENNGDHNLKDKKEYTLIEYAYYLMAIDAGINMNECRIYKVNDENHFMTKRFDRENGNKLHMQTLGALAHINFNEPCLCSYELAVSYMKHMNIGMKDIEQFYRRMVFNCLALNYDDHVKNVSFLMDKKGEWRLAPAYDITFSYNPTNKWLKAHQMLINNKKEDINLDDLLITGVNMGIKKNKCLIIVKEVNKVVDNFMDYAKKANIKKETYRDIDKIIKSKKITI